MPKILHLTASIRGEESVSRKLSRLLVDKLTAQTSSEVIHRDLSDNSLPLVTEALFAANSTQHNERSADQQTLAKIADELISELQQADTLVLGLPMYNFAAPATFKAWADLVARAGTTFEYTENGPRGFLNGKKVYLVVATGGTPVGSDFDHLTPWVKFFLAFLGMTDVEVIAADGVFNDDGEEKIQQATATIQALA